MPNDEKRFSNPGVAAVLSFLFSGLGQIYNGDIAKGLLIMLSSTLGLVCVIVGAISIGNHFLYNNLSKNHLFFGALFFVVGICILVVIGIYNIYDAYNVAKKRMG